MSTSRLYTQPHRGEGDRWSLFCCTPTAEECCEQLKRHQIAGHAMKSIVRTGDSQEKYFAKAKRLLQIIRSPIPTSHLRDRRKVALFMLLKSAILCDLYLLTYIICAIETPCDANLFLPFVSIHFFNSRRICD